MPTMIDKVREALDPQTTANSVYGMMVMWAQADGELGENLSAGARSTLLARRRVLEQCLALFFGVNTYAVRQLLREHFKPKVATNG